MYEFPRFNGSRDTRRYDEHNYQTITFADIRQMCANPESTAKQDAPAFIPSTYFGHLARNHAKQQEQGEFHALVADVDVGCPTLVELNAALKDLLGDCARIIYSSSSAKVGNRKWRAIIPIRETIAGSDYRGIQEAFFDEMKVRGIECDYAMARTGQPIYLPNVPPEQRDEAGVPLFYQHLIQSKNGAIHVPPAIVVRVSANAICRLEAENAAKEATERQTAKRRARAEITAMPSVIEAYLAEHDLTATLLKYGWERRGHDWFASPFSSSKGRSVWVSEQRAVSFTSSDAGALGMLTKNGWVTYDAWDVYTAFEHGGNAVRAVRSYAEHSSYNDRRHAAIIQNWMRV